MKVFLSVVKIFVTLFLVVADIYCKPTPQPSPTANPQIFWPWSLYQPFYSPVVAPRSLISWPIQPVTLVASQDPRVIPQSIDNTDEKSSHGRIKRALETELMPNSEAEVAKPKSIQKRQASAAYYQMPMSWPMSYFPLTAPSYAWATQSFATPGGSSSWTLVTV